MPDYWKKKDFWGRISLRDMIIMSKSISFIFSHKIDLNTEAIEFSFDLPKKKWVLNPKLFEITILYQKILYKKLKSKYKNWKWCYYIKNYYDEIEKQFDLYIKVKRSHEEKPLLGYFSQFINLYNRSRHTKNNYIRQQSVKS